MVNRGSIVPPWQQLAGILRGQIEAGELAPGQRVPAIVRLAQEYDMAPGTVRKALAALRDEGLIEMRTGWGTFVRET